MITAAQVKAARALLGLSQGDLAAMTGLGIATIKRLNCPPSFAAQRRPYGPSRPRWKRQGSSSCQPPIKVVQACVLD